MKPHIYLKHSWGDCGYEYQQWSCIGRDSKYYLRYGLGATPAAAYADWKRQTQ